MRFLDLLITSSSEWRRYRSSAKETQINNHHPSWHRHKDIHCISFSHSMNWISYLYSVSAHARSRLDSLPVVEVAWTWIISRHVILQHVSYILFCAVNDEPLTGSAAILHNFTRTAFLESITLLSFATKLADISLLSVLIKHYCLYSSYPLS